MNRMIKIYHGSKNNNKVVHFSNGRFGNGLYFFTDKKESKKWGKNVIIGNINLRNFAIFNYKDLLRYAPDLDIDEEEGLPKLENIIKSTPFKGVIIKYEDGIKEVIAYYKNVITY